MRTHYSSEVNESLVDKEIIVCGWVNKVRDHGGVIFIDLRDIKGLLQVVVNPDNKQFFKIAESVRNEYIISIVGKPRLRPAGSENLKLDSGKVEVVVNEMTILSKAETPPFQFDDNVNEDIRLKYRVHDLKSEKMQKNIIIRNDITNLIRNCLSSNNFLEIETPILTKATPEGARDYLVPSRINKGMFYALPQSPQIYKQILMISGYDRYFQIVKCFRDEDLRADRQPEFTQIDIEMSFVDEEDIFSYMEGLTRHIFETVSKINLSDSFPRITYSEAMEIYGSDKPDLRYGLKLIDLKNYTDVSDFKAFSTAQRVKGIIVKDGAKYSRKMIDELTDFIRKYKAKGLAWMKLNDSSFGGGISKFFSVELQEKMQTNWKL